MRILLFIVNHNISHYLTMSGDNSDDISSDMTGKYETFTQCCFDVGPPSATPVQQ